MYMSINVPSCHYFSIRFTALNIIACSCIVSVAVASQPISPVSKNPTLPFESSGPSNWAPALGVKSVIRYRGYGTEKVPPSQPPNSPLLHITVWLPQCFFPSGEDRQDVKHTKSQARPRNESTLSASQLLLQKPPNSIQLWLNKTSQIDSHLGPDIPRVALEIFGEVQF